MNSTGEGVRAHFHFITGMQHKLTCIFVLVLQVVFFCVNIYTTAVSPPPLRFVFHHLLTYE